TDPFSICDFRFWISKGARAVSPRASGLSKRSRTTRPRRSRRAAGARRRARRSSAVTADGLVKYEIRGITWRKHYAHGSRRQDRAAVRAREHGRQDLLAQRRLGSGTRARSVLQGLVPDVPVHVSVPRAPVPAVS